MFFDDVASRPVLTQAIGEKRIRRLAPRVYTADLRSAPFEIIAENRWQILARRPGLGPGRWKTEPNRVGAYPFVAPDLVEGTPAQGIGAGGPSVSGDLPSDVCDVGGIGGASIR